MLWNKHKKSQLKTASFIVSAQWCSQPKNFRGCKMFDFRWI